MRRRRFLKTVTAGSASMVLSRTIPALASTLPAPIRLGLITDTHIGLIDDGEDRLAAFLDRMKSFRPDGVMQLGDFAYPERRFDKLFRAFNDASPNPIHVIGNHDLDRKHTTEDCEQAWGIEHRYYTRSVGHLRIIVLDGNEKGSPTHAAHGGYPSYIGREQQQWLSDQLTELDSPAIIVSHQPLAGRIEIDNAADVRRIIAAHHDKVLFCGNGHSHVDQQLDIDGVTYLHFNSAAYFWMGGQPRLARYQDPLFATITINPEDSTITIAGVQSTWQDTSPDSAGYFQGPDDPQRKIVVPQIRNRSLSVTQKTG